MRRFIAVLCALSTVGAACGGSEAVTTVAPRASPTTTSTSTTTSSSTTTTTVPPATTTTLSPTTTFPPAEPARYRLTVENNWSEASHPEGLPNDAHFSWLAGATHEAGVSLWAVGESASPGVTEMAETGRTDILVAEIDVVDGIGATLDWPWWFCPVTTDNAKCGELSVEFDVDPGFPFVTLTAMIGPSPDWFVGVDGLSLLEDGRWRTDIVIALTPYDGGTRTSNRFALFGPRNDPAGPISVVTAESAQLIGPQEIGMYRFTLIDP